MTHEVGDGLIGGKAASWRLLERAGLAVPRGFCVSADEALDLDRMEHALQEMAKRGAVGSVAVRSSGVGEDGSAHSMAGLFESFLDVPADAASVLDAARRCRARGASARAISATGGPVTMGVLVQEMIVPVRSGVLFTADPLGESDGMVLEVVEGHLRDLVDGRARPPRHILTPASPSTVAGVNVAELQRLGREVEGLLGAPADIEWAEQDGRLVILQARPITSLHSTGDVGLTLVPVSASEASRLPQAVAQHDKIALRLVASELGIGISNGFVALANLASSDHVRAAASQISHWGEFIAVLLSPFDLDGAIFRKFGTGPTAESDLAAFVDTVGARHPQFSFLLKEMQDTEATGVAIRTPDGSVFVELIRGHFITKGHASPTTYQLDPAGRIATHVPGSQDFEMQVVAGRKVRVPVTSQIAATEGQLSEIRNAAVGLAARYPSAGVEFGFTPAGEFFLVDLYQSAAAMPPGRGDVLSAGRVVGRVRVLDIPDDAVEASIEKHVHSKHAAAAVGTADAEILVVRHPLYALDQLVYDASPGMLGFICEGGALLCHLAVVMRERGVPGLVMPGATRSFRDGELIELDTRPGSRAAVTRL